MSLIASLLAALAALNATAIRAAEPQGVRVLVAASAQDALGAATAEFTRQTKIEVTLNPGASNALATQIINGADADLFLSASLEWAEKLKTDGLVAESKPLLGNRLVLVVPVGNPAGVKSPQDLAAATVKHLALAGEKVPAGSYAQQALEKLKLYETLSDAKKIVRGQDVRATVTYVERGEAEAGIVYATDAKGSKKVEVVYTFDAASHDPIIYPLVLVATAKDRPQARQLFEFLQTPAAGKLFERDGFSLVPPVKPATAPREKAGAGAP